MLFTIKEPLTVSLDEIDVDNHIPSIEFKLDVAVNNLSCSLNYKGNVWITCNSLDAFISSIRNDASILCLQDIDGNNLLKLGKLQNNNYKLSLTHTKKTGNISEISINYSANITTDIFEIIKKSFLNYPVWW